MFMVSRINRRKFEEEMRKMNLENMSKEELKQTIKKAEELLETKPNKIQIKNRYTNEVIYETEAETIKEAVEKAVKEGVSLAEADLSRANLSRANLSRANLSRAYLSRANLSRANLSRAYLSEANLSEANLSRANLYRANLLYCKMNKKVFKQITEGWFEWKIVE